jgi:hypothetical protein
LGFEHKNAQIQMINPIIVFVFKMLEKLPVTGRGPGGTGFVRSASYVGKEER